MLPVALTCPLWWVARWATRMLTSLAVVAALALGSGASPASAASPDPLPASAASSGSPSSGWVVPTSSVALAAPVVVDRTAPPVSPDAHAAAPAVEAAVPAQAGAAAIEAGPQRSPRTADPATRASRAPPRR
ncbi:hypothetical protein [Micromonospora sp. CV4]|uniref:hypothetical protein n=1 Tax=Micromonospora sp. CV4 TaxID=2478711 RepID=UPI000EF490BB|nr:hypothetical protein [Micromonospora sp. CV4]RLP94487.1 hypothetical protein EAD98_16310 [Micromonospora sp. CV4]